MKGQRQGIGGNHAVKAAARVVPECGGGQEGQDQAGGGQGGQHFAAHTAPEERQQEQDNRRPENDQR